MIVICSQCCIVEHVAHCAVGSLIFLIAQTVGYCRMRVGLIAVFPCGIKAQEPYTYLSDGSVIDYLFASLTNTV